MACLSPNPTRVFTADTAVINKLINGKDNRGILYKGEFLLDVATIAGSADIAADRPRDTRF